MATHKFNDHLLNLSENKEIEKAIKEWQFVTKEKYEKLNRICVCQHKIKNVIYLFNILTRHTIAIGSTCFKKFNVTITDINPIIKKVLDTLREKGEYKEILDFNKFIIDAQQDVIDSFQKEYRNYRNDIDELHILKEYIYNVINDYGISYLNDTLVMFEKRIQELQKERQEREKQQERQKKEEKIKEQKEHIQHLEKERDILQEIYIKQELEAKEKLDQKEKQKRQQKEQQEYQEAFKKERELCKCGLPFGEICKCKSLEYILIPISKEYLCKICKKWKDRCDK